MSSKRIEYFDSAKALLIFFVVLGHILIILNPEYNRIFFSLLQSFIYSFHMPAFFLIHGILCNVEKWRDMPTKKYVLRRAYSLIVPYLFFEVIGSIWKAIFCNQQLMDGLYYLITIQCNVGADWFLPAMFMGSLLFMIYIKHPRKAYAVVSAVISFILPMFLPKSQFFIVLGRAFLAYGFIMTGHLIKVLFLSEKVKKLSILSMTFVGTTVVAVISLKWGGNDFYTCTVSNPITFVIGGIIGTIMILGLSRILECKMLTYIGKHSLIIMGTHQLVIYAITSLYPAIYGGNLIGGVGIMIAIILFEIPVISIFKQYFSLFVGRKMKAD